MFNIITDNAGTILVSLILIGIVTGIILHLRHRKNSCHPHCSCCPMAGSCHKS